MSHIDDIQEKLDKGHYFEQDRDDVKFMLATMQAAEIALKAADAWLLGIRADNVDEAMATAQSAVQTYKDARAKARGLFNE